MSEKNVLKNTWNPQQDMDRVWETAEMNIHFFDVISMHSPQELYLISEICRSFCPERIIEYGTAVGGLTRLFGRWAYLSDAKVLSIENGCYAHMKNLPKHRELLEMLPCVELLDANEYNQATYERVQEFAAEGRTMFYCDGGNKPLELRWCAAIMKESDLLVTHDYEPKRDRWDISGVALPPLLAEVGFVTKAQVEAIEKAEGLEKVFEEYLGVVDEETGKRHCRVLALQRKKSKE